MFEVTPRSVRTLSVVALYAHFFAAGSDSAACLPSSLLDARWCRRLLQQHCAQVLWVRSPSEPGCCLSASVLLVIRQNRSPGVSLCQFTDFRRVGHVVFGGAVVQVAAVVEGCHDAGIGNDPHRRGHGVQLRLGAASQFQRRSRSR